MEVVAALAALWRRRFRVVLGGVLSVALGVTLGGSPVPSSGLAKTRVVLDTPRSQLVSGAPSGAATLPWRATLAATLLGTDTARRQMAAEIGIPVDQLAVTDFELAAPFVPASLPRAAVKAADATVESYSLVVHTDNSLPVVSIGTSAPDRASATRLAEAAVHALQALATPFDTPDLQGMSVQQVGPIDSRELPGGAGHMKMAAMAVVLFGLWCSVLIVTGMRRKPKRRARRPVLQRGARKIARSAPVD
jgi:hypothetical protein